MLGIRFKIYHVMTLHWKRF